MKKQIFVLSLLSVLSSYAAPISPEQALRAVYGCLQADGRRMKMAKSAMRLAKTVTDSVSGDSRLYLFASEDSKGFIVAAADDDFPVFLGYSDSSVLDVGNLPPAFEYMLGWYSRQMDSAQVHGSGNNRVASVAKEEGRQAIAPILRTRWNQDEPYNNLCPEIDGKRSYAGCVATAAAQIMNAHQWPEGPSGWASYVYQYNDKTYSIYEQLEGKYDWGNMLDDYSSDYTSEQASAVAKLMHDVGLASKMKYKPQSSSTYTFYCAQGLVEKLGYALDARYLWRKWFSSEEWCGMIYSELAAGRPILYAGSSNTGAHAFVCDGYDGGGYYHINWGWGGLADGYFMLDDLNPYAQGIGGSEETEGYNKGQEMLVGIQRPDGTEAVAPVFAWIGEYATMRKHYLCNGQQIWFKGTIASYSVQTMRNVEIALRLKYSNGDIVYLPYDSYEEYNPLAEKYMYMNTNYFPIGRYEVEPVFKYAGEWHEVYMNKTNYSPLVFDVTEESIEIGNGEPFDDENTNLTFNLLSINDWSVKEIEPNSKNNRFSFVFWSDGGWNLPLAVALCSESDSGMHIEAIGEEVPVSIDKWGTEGRYTFTLDAPDLPLGQYEMALVYSNGDSYEIVPESVCPLRLVENSRHTDIKAELSNVNFNKDFVVKNFSENSFLYDISTEDGARINLFVALCSKIDGEYRIAAKGSENFVNLGPGQYYYYSFYLSIDSLPVGQYTSMLAYQVGDSCEFVPGSEKIISVSPPDPVRPKFQFVSSSPAAPYYSGETYTMNFDAVAAHWDGKLCLIILSPYNGIISKSEFQSVQFYDRVEKRLSFDITMPVGYDGIYLQMAIIEEKDKYLSESQLLDYILIEENATVADVVAGSGVDATYYDLQGRRVSRPLQPGIYLRMPDRKKIVVK